MKLLTRRQIIEIWNKDEKYHDLYCCPNCRDILQLYGDDSLRCKNEDCAYMNTTFGFIEDGKFIETRE